MALCMIRTRVSAGFLVVGSALTRSPALQGKLQDHRILIAYAELFLVYVGGNPRSRYLQGGSTRQL